MRAGLIENKRPTGHDSLTWVKHCILYRTSITGPGHMIKKAAMPICGKNPSKIFFSRTISQMTLNFGAQQKGLKPYKVYINDDLGLVLSYCNKYISKRFFFNLQQITLQVIRSFCWHQFFLIRFSAPAFRLFQTTFFSETTEPIALKFYV